MGYCGTTLQAADSEAPVGIDGFVRRTIGQLRGTMVDTVYWQMNTDPYWGTLTSHLTDWFSHDTKIGPRWGEGRKTFKTAGEWRIYENARDMMERGTDPPAVVIEHGHQAGLDVFLAFRFNDGHDHRLPGGLDDPNMSPMKREHPDWLLGPSVGDYSRFAYNFAHPEVRRYRMAVVAETIAKYDLDGLDFDFCRWPVLFKPGEGVAGARLITDLIRQTRALLDGKGATVGRKLFLSVRVPFPRDEATREGMDAAAWIREQLVDIVVVAGRGGGWHYRLPIEEYKQLAAGIGCRIVAQNLDGFKEARPRSAQVFFDERDYYSTEMHRAVAARHWQAGADGIFIWNQDWIKFARDDRFDPQSWKEIGSPEALTRLDKHYLVGPAGRGGSLPHSLARSGDRAEIEVEIADDFETAARQGRPVESTLRLMVDQLTTLDRMEYQLNGVKLDPATALKRYNYSECWCEFVVSGVLKRGRNQLKIAVQSRNPRVEAPLVIRSVEALVRYRDNAR